MARRRFTARFDELLFRAGTGAFAVLLIVIVVAIGYELYRQSGPSLEKFSLSLATPLPETMLRDLIPMVPPEPRARRVVTCLG